MNKKIVIADASPLIAFGRIDRISLLSAVLGNIIIPRAVSDECLVDISRPGASEIQKAIDKKMIHIRDAVDMHQHEILLDLLDVGEATAIALAVQLKAGLLIDEKLGRAAAKKLNLKVIGTAGVLLLAKQKKLIQEISPLILDLKKSGYFLSSTLIEEVLKRADEPK